MKNGTDLRRTLDLSVPMAAVVVFMLTISDLWPTMSLGAVGVDFYRSQLRALATVSHEPIIATVMGAAQYASVKHGAWLPLQTIPFLFWAASSSGTLGRLLQVFAIGLNVVTFFFVLRRFLGLRSALFACMVAIMGFQVRLDHSSILAPCLALPIFVEFVLVSILGIQLFYSGIIREGAILAVAGAASACLFSVTGFLISFSFGMVSLIVKRSRHFLALTLSLTFIPLLCVLLASWRGFGTAPTVHNETLHGTFLDFLRSVALQFLSPLPTSYRFSGGLLSHVAFVPFQYDSRFQGVPSLGLLAFFVGAGVAATIAITFPCRQTSAQRAAAPVLIGIGLSLWLLPALVNPAGSAASTMLPTSSQYLSFSYLQVFGVAILAAVAVLAFSDCVAKWPYRNVFVLTAGLASFFVASGNVQLNSLVSSRIAGMYGAPRIVTRAARAGAFADLPLHTTIILDNSLSQFFDQRYPFGTDSAFLYKVSKRKFRTLWYGSTGTTQFLHCASGNRVRCNTTAKNAFLLSALPQLTPPGVVIARISSVKDAALFTSGAIAFVLYPDTASRDQQLADPSYEPCVFIKRTAVGNRGLIMRSKRLCGDVGVYYPFTLGKPPQ